MLSIGIPKEIKSGEFRVAGLPVHVQKLRAMGGEVIVQQTAGVGAGFADDQYRQAGAVIVSAASDVFERAGLIWKVKEILPEEFTLLRSGQIIFTYLHACPRPDMTQALKASGCTAIAYEEVLENQRRPLLAPMSRLAGAGAVLLAGQFSQSTYGGCGKLLFATDGTQRMVFVIIGAGSAGRAACAAALAAGCEVHLLEANEAMLPQLRREYPAAEVAAWSAERFEGLLARLDVLVNCTLWMQGDPHLLTRPMLKRMRPGSLIMDISADPNGAIESSQMTTHDDPLRTVDGVLHYCVQNIPSLFARSASEALSAATWPYLQTIVREGLPSALRGSASLRGAVVASEGNLFGADLARIQAIPTQTPNDLLRTLEAPADPPVQR